MCEKTAFLGHNNYSNVIVRNIEAMAFPNSNFVPNKSHGMLRGNVWRRDSRRYRQRCPSARTKKSVKGQSRSPRSTIDDGYGERGYNGIKILYLQYFSLLAIAFDRRPLPTAADDCPRPPYPFSRSTVVVLVIVVDSSSSSSNSSISSCSNPRVISSFPFSAHK